jgi:hypothetical protein
MNQYTVKLGFWVRAHEDFEIETRSDEEAIEAAKRQAAAGMETEAVPDSFDYSRREGVILFIDRQTAGRLEEVATDVEFDADRIHGIEATAARAACKTLIAAYETGIQAGGVVYLAKRCVRPSKPPAARLAGRIWHTRR